MKKQIIANFPRLGVSDMIAGVDESLDYSLIRCRDYKKFKEGKRDLVAMMLYAPCSKLDRKRVITPFNREENEDYLVVLDVEVRGKTETLEFVVTADDSGNETIVFNKRFF